MAESNLILALIDGLNPRVAPQVVGHVRADLEAFVNGDFKVTKRTLCMYGGSVDEGWDRGIATGLG